MASPNAVRKAKACAAQEDRIAGSREGFNPPESSTRTGTPVGFRPNFGLPSRYKEKKGIPEISPISEVPHDKQLDLSPFLSTEKTSQWQIVAVATSVPACHWRHASATQAGWQRLRRTACCMLRATSRERLLKTEMKTRS